ncbi:uncharacterized protein [Clytia hemisphaerica]|uniref:uncharacterized protein n=1 Tax=Clytia hemisphaerica TaxID=252671 RepID=UPI0034D5619B
MKHISKSGMFAVFLRVFTGLCLLASLFLGVISVASHRWIERYAKNGTQFYHMGLWKFCDMKQCHVSIETGFILNNNLGNMLKYVRILFCVGVFANLVALSYFMFDCLILMKKGHLMVINMCIILSGVLKGVGMILFTEHFKVNNFQWGWSHTVGLSSAILLAVALLTSFYYMRKYGWTEEDRRKKQKSSSYKFDKVDFDGYD